MPKRKQPDDEASSSIFDKHGPLTNDPIENEYEYLEDDDAAELDDDDSQATKQDNLREIERFQEPATVSREGDIKLTPFNLEEELQDGEFDKSGNFIFKPKEADDDENEGGNDTWAETVDWNEVERLEKEKRMDQRAMDVSDCDDIKISKPTEYDCYRQMLRIMSSEETVQKTIRRLGKNIPRRRPQRKSQSSSLDPIDKKTLDAAKLNLDRFIELVDLRFRDGDLDIYQKSYDDIEEGLNKLLENQ